MAPVHSDRARLLDDALRQGGRYGSEEPDQQGTYDERPRGGRQERERREQQARRLEERALDVHDYSFERASEGGRGSEGGYQRGSERRYEMGHNRSNERAFGRTQERDNEKDSKEGKETTGSKRKRPGRSTRRKQFLEGEGALVEGTRDNEQGSEGEQALNRRHRRMAARSSGQGVPPSTPPAQQHHLELEKAREMAVDYPKSWDTKDWHELAKETDQELFKKHADVYWHLRLDERPQHYTMKGWNRKVHREMEDLGFEEGKDTSEHVEKEVEVVEKKEEVRDDEFDIDIYGDEETRAKYEPWIKSTMMKT
jgi:hypothetical protein